jgi:CreA protein
MNQGWKVKWGAGFAAALVVLGLLVHWHHASENRNVLGSVNTEFKLIGPDHKIIIESYDDPKIDGITVFISKSQTGGIKGALGLAEDTSDASVAVRQTGPIKVKETFENGEDAFTEKRSVLFKRLHVSRFWDAPHKSLCMWCGPTGSSTARRRIRFRRWWRSRGEPKRLICR